jgi:hypothetical protein
METMAPERRQLASKIAVELLKQKAQLLGAPTKAMAILFLLAEYVVHLEDHEYDYLDPAPEATQPWYKRWWSWYISGNQ